MAGQRQFDEERVLDRALDLFWRKGLPATSMLDLAAETGVQRGSLYNAYGSKEALFLKCFDRYAAGFLDGARTALSDPDPRRGLEAFFATAITNMTAGAPARGCLTTRTATEATAVGKAVRTRLQKLLDELEALVTAALSSETARPRLALDPSRAARVAVTFTRGLAVMERAYGEPSRLRESAAALVDALLPDPPADNRPIRRRSAPRAD